VEPKPATTGRGFRPDIQGLRAIAVGSVVLYHLWPHRLQGGFVGVDIFFVISGFLITSHLLAKPPRRPRDFAAFWARRIRRLLPASLLVVAVVLLASWAIAPTTTWHDTGTQAEASALYVQNWALAFSSTDYLAADNAATPLQHFWSLSVEEQFYFVWPLVVAALVALGLVLRRGRAVVTTGLAVVVAAGLVFSVWYTGQQQAMAYFVTTTRLWELAAGGLTAALVFAWPRAGGRRVASPELPDLTVSTREHVTRAVVAWLGLAGIVVSIFVTDPQAPFPGTAAILPVVSTAVVLGAKASGPGSPAWLLGWRPAQFIGNTSYSLYLWHWPMIVLLPALVGTLAWPHKLLIIAASVLLAWGTQALIEVRFRRIIDPISLSRIFAATLVAMLVVVGGGIALSAGATAQQNVSLQRLAEAEKDPNSCLGAAALAPGAGTKSACRPKQSLLLDPLAAKTDKSDAYPDGCWSNQPFTKRPTCTYGDGPTQVALVGNSHAGHWLPALQVLAKQRGWTITTFLVSRCAVNAAPQTFDAAGASQRCTDYGTWVKKQTTSGKFDAIITSERQSVTVQGKSWPRTEAASQKGYVPFLEAWHRAHVPVVVLHDVPFPGAAHVNVPDCLAQHGDDASVCQGTPATWHWMDPLADATTKTGYADQHVVQTQDWVCPGGVCQPVIGRVVTYFDDSHLTATYAKTLAPLMGQALDKLKIKGL